MGRGYDGAVMKVFGAQEHTITVTGVEDLTGHFRRVTFDAPTFFDGKQLDPACFVRLWVSDPDKPGREHQRGYTIVDPDPENNRLSLDFLLHDPAGPASAWAKRAKAGDRIQMSWWTSPHFTVPDPAPDGYLLMGDAASIPGINAILAELPETAAVEVVLEQFHDEDRLIPVAEHPGATVRWVPTTGANTLANALDSRDWSNWYAWLTGETAAVKQARVRLKELGFPKTDVHGRAYWSKGKAMGTDRERPAPAPVEKKPSQWRSRSGARLLAPLATKLTIAGLFQAVVTLLQLAPYLLLAELGRRLLAGQGDLARLGLAALAFMGAGATLAGLLVTAMHVVDASFGHRVRSQVIGKLSRMPLGWFGERSSGRIKQAVQDDATDLHYLVTHAVLDVVGALVAPLAVLVYLFTVSGWLASVLLIPLIAYSILTGRMVQASASQLAQFSVWESRVASEAVAYLDGLSVVRTYDAGPAKGFRATLTERAAFLYAWQRPFTGRKTMVDLVTRPLTSLLLITVAGGLMLSAGIVTAPDLLAFLLLGVTFGGQLLAMGYGLSSIRDSRNAAQRIGLLLAEPELSTAEAPKSLAGERFTVGFEEVGFSYDGRHHVLQDINLTLSPGTVTALAGPSGAGKSTLAALLARFHDPTRGRVTLNGIDLRDLSFEELYRTVGFVFQDVSLVSGTVHDNIALGRPSATRDEVAAAAVAAGIHERIMALPNGYDTVDARLSGGEAQRLTIARVLIADPRVLVLDEATAFADPESEYQVQQAISRLIADRTVLVIAHRLHTITGVDAIAVLDAGRIVQHGTHTELLATPGLYRELWQAAQLHEVTL